MTSKLAIQILTVLTPPSADRRRRIHRFVESVRPYAADHAKQGLRLIDIEYGYHTGVKSDRKDSCPTTHSASVSTNDNPVTTNAGVGTTGGVSRGLQNASEGLRKSDHAPFTRVTNPLGTAPVNQPQSTLIQAVTGEISKRQDQQTRGEDPQPHSIQTKRKMEQTDVEDMSEGEVRRHERTMRRREKAEILKPKSLSPSKPTSKEVPRNPPRAVAVLHKSKNDKQYKRGGRTVDEILRDFNPPNVHVGPSGRLTMVPQKRMGLFSNGKASGTVSIGVPHTTFDEAVFLGRKKHETGTAKDWRLAWKKGGEKEAVSKVESPYFDGNTSVLTNAHVDNSEASQPVSVSSNIPRDLPTVVISARHTTDMAALASRGSPRLPSPGITNSPQWPTVVSEMSSPASQVDNYPCSVMTDASVKPPGWSSNQYGQHKYARCSTYVRPQNPKCDRHVQRSEGQARLPSDVSELPYGLKAEPCIHAAEQRLSSPNRVPEPAFAHQRTTAETKGCHATTESTTSALIKYVQHRTAAALSVSNPSNTRQFIGMPSLSEQSIQAAPPGPWTVPERRDLPLIPHQPPASHNRSELSAALDKPEVSPAAFTWNRPALANSVTGPRVSSTKTPIFDTNNPAWEHARPVDLSHSPANWSSPYELFSFARHRSNFEADRWPNQSFDMTTPPRVLPHDAKIDSSPQVDSIDDLLEELDAQINNALPRDPPAPAPAFRYRVPKEERTGTLYDYFELAPSVCSRGMSVKAMRDGGGAEDMSSFWKEGRRY